jgi:hypothetical protein
MTAIAPFDIYTERAQCGDSDANVLGMQQTTHDALAATERCQQQGAIRQ